MATSLKIGAHVRVSVGGKEHEGILRYLGPVQGAIGHDTWAGIELPGPTGKNNGSAKGRQYFQCPDLHGLFVKMSSVTLGGPSSDAGATMTTKSEGSKRAAAKRNSASERPPVKEPARNTTPATYDGSVRTLDKFPHSEAPMAQISSAQLESELELATIDREMAEEKLIAVQYELELCKSKNDELELEIEVLREENKELGSTMTHEEKNNAGWIHLERERDRLKEALLMLRDHNQEMEIEYRHEIETLRSDLATTEDTAIKYLETAESLNRAEDLNTHLREQLEAAENQEDVIAGLIQERDKHTSQIEDLQNTLAELEDLAATNEDLEQMYLEQQKDLHTKVDMCELENHELHTKTQSQSQIIEDLEYTLNRMRSMVQNLQADIDEAHRSKEISELQANELGSKSKAMMDLNIKLQNNAGKSQNRGMELDLTKAQVTLLTQQLSILSLFLPETFDSERPAIAALLSFGRLKLKAAAAANVLGERLRDRAHLLDEQQLVSAYNSLAPLRSIQHTAQLLEHFMSSCTPSEFAKFNHVNQDLEPVERAVTLWLETLKNDELNADSFENMERMYYILHDITEKLITESPEANAAQSICQVKIAAGYIEVTASVLDWAHDSLSTEDDTYPALRRLTATCRSVRVLCSRITQDLEKRMDNNMCLNPEFMKINSFHQETRNLFETTIKFCGGCISGLTDSDLDIDSTIGSLTTLGQSCMTAAELISAQVLDQHSYLPFESNEAPWIVRAKALKGQKQLSLAAQEELVQYQRQNGELAGRITEKEKQIEELSIRAEFAEKRVKESKSKEAQDKELKDEIERLQRVKVDLDKELACTKSDLTTLHAEHEKDRAQLLTLQSVSEAPSGVHTPAVSTMETGGNELLSARIRSLLTQIADLQATVRHLKRENHQLAVPTSKVRMNVLLNLEDLGKKRPVLNNGRQKRKEIRDALLSMTEGLQIVQLDDKNLALGAPPVWKSVRETSAWKVARTREIWQSYVALE